MAAPVFLQHVQKASTGQKDSDDKDVPLTRTITPAFDEDTFYNHTQIQCIYNCNVLSVHPSRIGRGKCLQIYLQNFFWNIFGSHRSEFRVQSFYWFRRGR